MAGRGHEPSCRGLQWLVVKLHPKIPPLSPAIPCAPLACHVLQLGRAASGSGHWGAPCTRFLGAQEGRGEELGVAPFDF